MHHQKTDTEGVMRCFVSNRQSWRSLIVLESLIMSQEVQRICPASHGSTVHILTCPDIKLSLCLTCASQNIIQWQRR